MIYKDETTYYDVLDVNPDATPQEIRTAYLRAKAAYNKDSVALYSLVPSEDTGSLLDQIEQAYSILSHSEKRREYDRLHGLILVPQTPVIPAAAQASPIAHDPFTLDEMPNNVVSIDRVPPMEPIGQDFLVAPSTDFSTHGGAAIASAPMPEPRRAAAPAPIIAKSVEIPNREAYQAIADEIAAEINWHGTFLKKVREARQISIEEVAEHTRIKKTYISAIEEENYDQLPASVFVRGFITQLARMLKLPHEKVTNAYMGRFLQAQAQKNK